MKQFKHSFVVDNDIDTVWKFYTNIKHLEIITPKMIELKIIKSESTILNEGAEVTLRAKLLTSSQWNSKITHLKPYAYTDEMISGRFTRWRHLHQFNKLGDKKTEIIDRIEFELPYGPIGKILEKYVCRKLENIFAYRERATVESLQSDLTNPTH